jgi:adenine-specific DNA-methyltransferase
MSDSLTDLILSLTPEDGSSIGNGAMMALLRERVPGLTDDDYAAARNALVDDGLLARGRGRGGSIMRVVDADEDEDDGADGGEGTADAPVP